jgi:hypothetical protein
MPESARVSWLQDIYTKMKRAERGECTFGPTPQHDVDQMACAPIVLELRITDYFGRDPEDPDGDLVILDELGFAPLDDTGTQLLFRLVAGAYERRSLAIGSHWPFNGAASYPNRPERGVAEPLQCPTIRKIGHPPLIRAGRC